MFRYLSLAWDIERTPSAAAAQWLGADLQARPGWTTEVSRPGLLVLTTGSAPGVNGAYPLGDRGVVLGRLFRRTEFTSVPQTRDVALSEAEQRQAIESRGASLIDGFWGRYVALMASGSGAVDVLRDPGGTLPCFVLDHLGVRIVFSWLEDVLDMLPDLPSPLVSWDGVVAQLLLGDLGGHETALQGVSTVLPGERLRLNGPGDRMNHELLWSAPDAASRSLHEDPSFAQERLRETVQATVRAWASCYDGLLMRLSGGVDSSIVLSCLREGDTPARVNCLNYHSPGADSDERHYARLAAGKAGRRLIELERDTSFRLERTLAIARTPTPSNYVGRMTARTDAQTAADCSAAAMFTGGGGDQLFFEFLTWWPAADYLQVRGLDRGFAAVAVDAARLGRTSVWQVLRHAFAERLRPSRVTVDVAAQLTLLSDDTQRTPLATGRFVHPALLRPAKVPIGKLTQAWQLMHPGSYYDPLEREAAPETVHPLLSQPLVELALKLPTWELTRGGHGRALARRAFADGLPPEIATRRAKGGMEEHVRLVLLRNLDFARSMLLDGCLVRQGILDRKRVEAALENRPTATMTHLGEIHICIGIEAWLQAWASRRRTAA